MLAPTSVTSDGNGEARASLTTTGKARVTASVVGGTSASLSATLDIPVRVGPTVTISVPASSLVPGVPATFSVAVTAGGAAVRSASIEFGDGGRQAVSTSGNSTATHVYSSSGTYIVTARGDRHGGRDGHGHGVGQRAGGRGDRQHDRVAHDARTTGAPAEFTATATTTPAGTTIERYEWNFGDGAVRTTTSGNVDEPPRTRRRGPALRGVGPGRDDNRRVRDRSARASSCSSGRPHATRPSPRRRRLRHGGAPGDARAS